LIYIMKKKWFALAASLALLVLSVSCGSLVLLWSIWPKQPEPPPADTGSNWISDFIKDDPNKGRGHLTIIGAALDDAGELVWKTTYEVKGDPTRLQGAVARYKSKASGAGKITVTTVSITIDGKERIKDQDRQRVVWDVKRNADGTLEIRRPYAGQVVMFLFRKEN
jgi:hypothetical protein